PKRSPLRKPEARAARVAAVEPVAARAVPDRADAVGPAALAGPRGAPARAEARARQGAPEVVETTRAAMPRWTLPAMRLATSQPTRRWTPPWMRIRRAGRYRSMRLSRRTFRSPR